MNLLLRRAVKMLMAALKWNYHFYIWSNCARITHINAPAVDMNKGNLLHRLNENFGRRADINET